MTVRRYARRPDHPDVRDARYRPAALGLLAAAPPARGDLRSALPPAFDQGAEGSCGPNSASALMCLLYGTSTPRSRQQIYYSTRLLENTIREDAGVETRDLFRVLQKTGAAPEPSWRYEQGNLYRVPPPSVFMAARECRISSYSRLVGESDFVSCLAEGFPFVLGFEVFDSLESDEVARTGVWRVPGHDERDLGGHDVLVVGYDMNFRASDDLARSGIDPSAVEDHALLIRNSWGAEWGIQGHFWMPMSLAVNPSIGGDAWTGRR